MSKAIITESLLTGIADAIREKTGTTETITPSEMANAISNISTGSGEGGITPTGEISIISNGTYDVTEYASAKVNVPTGGSGVGGNAIQIGQESPVNMAYLFHILENGLGVSGEYITESYLPNTETLIISSGLETINGFMIMDVDWVWDGSKDALSTPEYTVFGLYMPNANISFSIMNTRKTDENCFQRPVGGFNNNYSPIVRATTRIDGGNVYVTSLYNANASYTPFMPNHKYKWVAW